MMIWNRMLAAGMIAICLTATAKAEDNLTMNGVQYTTTSQNTATAFMTVKATGDVEVKEEVKIKGKIYKVTKIGRSFAGKNEYLQSVVIPNSVQEIRKGAFKGCTNLVNVVVPDTLCLVEAGAFDGCTAIAYVRAHNRDYSVDYALSAMPKDIPYYEVKDEIGGFVRGGQVKEILNDREYDVDVQIPETGAVNANTFAFIIGNEDYTMGEAGIPNVAFAENDAKVFAQYCEKTLGIPSGNIKLTVNATLGRLRRSIRLLKETAEANKVRSGSSIIFYYAGHGIPNEETKSCYLLPTDADGKSTDDCYSMATLYQELSDLPVEKVYVFLDACFSGSQRGDGMLASARGVAIKAKEQTPQGNMVVFSAAQGIETAYPYKEKHHGMFTYYLLNQLCRYKGDCTLGELGSYIERRVSQKSISVNGKSQTPTVTCSPSLAKSWEQLKLK